MQLAKETKAFEKCTCLALDQLGLTDKDIANLATIPFTGLIRPRLGLNNFTTLKPLIGAKMFPKLEELEISEGSIPEEKIEALKRSSNFPSLKRLKTVFISF